MTLFPMTVTIAIALMLVSNVLFFKNKDGSVPAIAAALTIVMGALMGTFAESTTPAVASVAIVVAVATAAITAISLDNRILYQTTSGIFYAAMLVIAYAIYA